MAVIGVINATSPIREVCLPAEPGFARLLYSMSDIANTITAGDLLMRHRRRCQPNKVFSKRKACMACVKAKIRCSYTQPSCLRCSKREIACEYPIHLDNTPAMNDFNSTETIAMNSIDIDDSSTVDINQTSSHVTNEMSTPLRTNTSTTGPEDGKTTGVPTYIGDGNDLGELDSEFQWSIGMSPLAFEVFDGTMDGGQDISLPSITSLATTTDNSLTVPTASPVQSTVCGADFPSIPVDLAADAAIVTILRQYPRLLLSEDYRSPFLHRELYSGIAPDMTALSRTSMAICCSAAFECRESRSYVRRAIDANRHDMIQAFVCFFPQAVVSFAHICVSPTIHAWSNGMLYMRCGSTK